METGQLLTPEQVAERLQVARLTVIRWLRAARLQGFKQGKIWRVREADLERFIATHVRSQRQESL